MVNDAQAMDQVRDLVAQRFGREISDHELLGRLVDLVEDSGRVLIEEVDVEGDGSLRPANQP